MRIVPRTECATWLPGNRGGPDVERLWPRLRPTKPINRTISVKRRVRRAYTRAGAELNPAGGSSAGLYAAPAAAVCRSYNNAEDENDCSCTQTVYEPVLIVFVAIHPRRDEYPRTQDHVDPASPSCIGLARRQAAKSAISARQSNCSRRCCFRRCTPREIQRSMHPKG